MGLKNPPSNRRSLSRKERDEGWRLTTCIRCHGKTTYHDKKCTLCDGVGRIVTHV